VSKRYFIAITAWLVMLLFITGCGSKPASTSVDLGASDKTKTSSDSAPQPSDVDKSELPKQPGFVGYVVKKEDGRILVVNPTSHDNSANGGMSDYYRAAWFSNAPAEVEVGQQVEVWAKDGKLNASYPAQGETEHLIVKPGLQPEGAVLSEAEAIHQALSTKPL
jgi:hypothetical protein